MLKDYFFVKSFLWSCPFKGFSQSKSIDILFIRHAHSQFNQACEQFRIKNQIPWDWNLLTQHPAFQQEVAFNKNYIDCSLTQKGINQCLRARSILKDQKVDVILVSPQERALQTCQYIFEKRQIPVKVVPILNGPLWSACDISGSYVQKMKRYPLYDFSLTQIEGQFWYLKHLSIQQKEICQAQFSKRNVKTLLQKKLIILELLKNHKINQSPSYLRRRSDKLKQFIKTLDRNYTKIAIVSHFYKIQYAISKQFSQIDEPIKKVDIPNCTPYRISSEELFKPTLTISRSIF